MKTILYVMALDDNKYYVGQTDNPSFRADHHVRGIGAKWTMLYKPISREPILIKEIEVENMRDAILYENWLTFHFMEKYGWENVRGGEFLQIEKEAIRAAVNRLLDTETNKIRDFVKICQENFKDLCKYFYGVSNYWLVYVLELEKSKYYIGSTKRLGKNLADQFVGNGINWTRIYKPVRLLELQVVPDGENYLALKDRKRGEYMDKFGRDNVKGGNE
jgi:predicted GIY-YIG superfamily endonuclease